MDLSAVHIFIESDFSITAPSGKQTNEINEIHEINEINETNETNETLVTH